MIRQLAFDLPFRAALGREDFFVSQANATALTTIDSWRGWPLGKMVLTGPKGSGKTHLTHVWAAMAGAQIVNADSLATADVPVLAETGAIAIEDCDKLAQIAEGEDALFHLHNLLAAQQGTLLMTADTAPRDWGLTLPDLISRVQAASLVRLEPPDDALLSAVLIKLFADRQIVVSPTLIPYLITRMDRSFDAARALVAALDAEALARGGAITRAMAASLLDKS